MDQAIRNKLRGVVTQCRRRLEDCVSQELQGKFGVYAGRKDEVQVDDDVRMSHLGDEERAARKDVLDHLDHIKARGFKAKDALDQLVREVAFTHLNRLCAYKMMEARQVYVGDGRFREAVSRGVHSNGVKFYLAEHPDDERLFAGGRQDVAYRHFLDWLGGLLSEEIGVLFSPHDPANRLYPPQRVLDEVLALINDEALADVWAQDETIGWVYQYFTPKELRDQARKESQAPRNSYELAFRNQFFTPRYVVEFLTDNTLGRIWYEMRKGDTRLRDQCRYMVRRPTEVFLKAGEAPPPDAEVKDDLPQEELLKLPVYVLHRAKKDPRELKVLDPACGSGHFLLYCFDLLLTIYEEAYGDDELGPALRRDYPTWESLRRDVPRLILAHNLHGIDIDLRATQIAALALWLRCQRAYQDMGLKRDRPRITRSNVVCAEPMPGTEAEFQTFIAGLNVEVVARLMGQVIGLSGGNPLSIDQTDVEDLRRWMTCVWRDMRLASNVGSLLLMLAVGPRLQHDIAMRIRERFVSLYGHQLRDFFTSEQEAAKGFTRLVIALFRKYVAEALPCRDLREALFRDDVRQGLAFVELECDDYWAVLMNPPFGDCGRVAKVYIDKYYPRTKNDLYAAFVEQGLSKLLPAGLLGAITSRTGFFLSTFQKWREEVLLDGATPTVFADLGHGVLDTAMVETAAYCIGSQRSSGRALFARLQRSEDKPGELANCIAAARTGKPHRLAFELDPQSFRQIPGSPFAYWISDHVRHLFNNLPTLAQTSTKAVSTNPLNDDFRYFRLAWEAPANLFGRSKGWVHLSKGGDFARYYSSIHLVAAWDDARSTYKEFEGTVNRPLAKPASVDLFFSPGLTYSRRSQIGFSARCLPSGCIFHDKGPGIFPVRDRMAWLGILNSTSFAALLSLNVSFGSYEVGVLQRTPVPMQLDPGIGRMAERAVKILMQPDQLNELSHLFVNPFVPAEDVAQQEANLSAIQADIDALAAAAYRLTADDLAGMTTRSVPTDDVGEVDDSEFESCPAPDEVSTSRTRLSYAVGCAFGRWDVRCATGERAVPPLPDPFDPLPVCSPGMLQGEDGLPLRESPTGYPVAVEWGGILVDDPDHPSDIVRRVQEVFDLLNLPDEVPRDYFRKPGKGGFWDDHVSRYSKSRRKAPIYWLLQSSKKNYALWLYYHRLDKDLLFKALVNYVEPKIRLEDSRLDTLRAQKAAAGGTGRDARRLGKELERQEEFLSELRDFEDKLRRAANLHLEPDLNDGVVLNIAPLWELVPWKEAKTYWQQLLDGQYEWSSIGKQLREKGHVHGP